MAEEVFFCDYCGENRFAGHKCPKDDPVFWLSPLDSHDDFGDPFKDVMIDGKTKMGPWANMTPVSWAEHGGTGGRFGTGLAQRYEKQPNGRWLKVEG